MQQKSTVSKSKPVIGAPLDIDGEPSGYVDLGDEIDAMQDVPEDE